MPNILVGHGARVSFEGLTQRLELRQKERRWRFPYNRFIEYTAEDERHALEQGWSGHGGEECEVDVSYVFPRCIVHSVNADGIDFTALPDIGDAT